ncbi:hypothetical protein FOZ61_001224 [Perkinsus olseni]|uniref:Uncharacterized protein n=1 Tax=Perkinsus olseni TaxID=32597 RepID=A0A7J6KQ92_PEROL|nr:hypothetical protein FOZ61_001224 [Perkinsus olseni]
MIQAECGDASSGGEYGPCQTAMQIVGRIGRYIKSSPKRLADWKAFTQRTGEVAEVLSLRIYQAASTSPPITMSHFLLMEVLWKRRLKWEKVTVETPVGNPLAVQRQGGPASGIYAALVNYESLLDNFGERSSDVGKPSSAEGKARAREFLNSLVKGPLTTSRIIMLSVSSKTSMTGRALHEYSQDWESLTAFYEQVKADARRLNIEAPELQRAARRGLRTSALKDEQIDNLLIVNKLAVSTAACGSSSATSLMRSMMSMIWEWTIPNGIADRGGYSDLGTCER